MQTFPNQTVLMLSHCFDGMDFFLYEKHQLCTVRREKWTSRLNVFDITSLLSHGCGVYGLHIKTSTTAHPPTGMSCFANQKYTEGDVIGY